LEARVSGSDEFPETRFAMDIVLSPVRASIGRASARDPPGTQKTQAFFSFFS
jgi:hypothetical protein